MKPLRSRRHICREEGELVRRGRDLYRRDRELFQVDLDICIFVVRRACRKSLHWNPLTIVLWKYLHLFVFTN